MSDGGVTIYETADREVTTEDVFEGPFPEYDKGRHANRRALQALLGCSVEVLADTPQKRSLTMKTIGTPVVCKT